MTQVLFAVPDGAGRSGALKVCRHGVECSGYGSACVDCVVARAAFEEEKAELKLQRDAGVLDQGQDSDLENEDESWEEFLRANRDAVDVGDCVAGQHFPLSRAVPSPTCFSLLCKLGGVPVSLDCASVSDLGADQRGALAEVSTSKVWFTFYAVDDPRNHVEAVRLDARSATLALVPTYYTRYGERTVGVTSYREFFGHDSRFEKHRFYMEDTERIGDGASEFGADTVVGPGADAHASDVPQSVADIQHGLSAPGFGTRPPPSEPLPARGAGGSQRAPYAASANTVRRPASVADEDVGPGASNMSGGVVRRTRRTIQSKGKILAGEPVARNYGLHSALMFNNADEMFQDMISREYAQEIIEDLFGRWGVPFNQPAAMKYAEDLLFLFMITNTASNKADYNQVFPIPVEPFFRGSQLVSEVDADFAKFSSLLESVYGKTRRQFARAIADDQKNFLRHEENKPLLPRLATRVGCETLLAYLSFDGSTHCTGLTSREITFVKTLENRNLFEREDVIAENASARLMQGMSGGVRSVAPR